jgi:oligoribonuclease NrnB/cAMP/cGMP phosphodiesterase (DHH superfamily)
MYFDDTLRKAVILHHNDMDGVVAARIMYDYIRTSTNIEMVETVACSYNRTAEKKILDPDYDLSRSILIILDYSLEPEDLLDMVDLLTIRNIIWIDHHISAIQKMASIADNRIGLIPGLRVSAGLCAAELTWLFVHGATQPFTFDNKIIYHGVTYDTSKQLALDALLEKIPIGTVDVGDWDVYRHKINDRPDGIYLEKYYRKELPSPKAFNPKVFIPFLTDDPNDPALIAALAEGKLIYEYELSQYSSKVKHNGFPAIITGFKDIEAIAINMEAHTGKVFESVPEIYDTYEVGVVYNYNGKKWVYSFYRLGKNPEKIINCAAIAMTFGGGGHIGAAGCTVDSDIVVITQKSKPVMMHSWASRVVKDIPQLLTLVFSKPGMAFEVIDPSMDSHVPKGETNVIYIRIGGPNDYKSLRRGWMIAGLVDPIDTEPPTEDDIDDDED